MKRKAIVSFALIVLFLASVFSKSISYGAADYSACALNSTASAYKQSYVAGGIVDPSPSEQTYSLTFTRSGLRSGVVWSVALDSQYYSSYSDSITISVPDGAYAFSIPEVGGWPTGYTASPSSGSVTMKGENISVHVTFNPTTLGFPSLIVLLSFIITALLASVVIVLVVHIAGKRAYRWRKSLRYMRWASKAAFLLLYIVPIAYLVGVPWRPVYSLFFDIQVGKPYLIVPITQSVCITWTTHSMTNINPGEWVACPLGTVQTLLTGFIDELHVIPTIIAVLLFIIPIVLLGNFFCSWVCPLGTIIDAFDKSIEKISPKIEAKREKRSIQSRQDRNNKLGSNLLCPTCPLIKVISNRKGVLAYGILGSAVIGSFVLKIPVFCSVCPIGIISRGIMHLKSLSMWLPTARVTGQLLAIVPELAAIPVAAVLMSLRERRFWCKKLCPVGGLLSGLGALNPFIKPRVKEEKCIMRGCPDECDDYHIDYCIICRYEDDRKCEKVCPVDINLVDHGSLHKCTKCMECYIACDHNAVKVDLLGKPDVFRIGRFFKRLRARRQKDQVTPIENSAPAKLDG
jgi:ferredoxin-type protein NapH